MYRRIFSVFLNSHSESYQLEERYRLTTTRLGWITVAIGCLALVSVMYKTWLMFGLPLNRGNIEGFRLKLISWIVLTIALVPIGFYAGMALVYGTYGFAMFVLGQFSWQQTIDFSLRVKYLRRWYK